MKAGFRTKVFVGAFAAAALSLLALASLMAWQVVEGQRAAIERHLSDEAYLAADLLSKATALADESSLDTEADRLGELISARVTFIAEDGRVVGDSTQSEAELPTLENHLTRPEVVAAREHGFGSSERYSGTISTDMVYVAVRATHPVVTYVRLALPLTDVDAQLAAIVRATLGALAASIPLAL